MYGVTPMHSKLGHCTWIQSRDFVIPYAQFVLLHFFSNLNSEKCGDMQSDASATGQASSIAFAAINTRL